MLAGSRPLHAHVLWYDNGGGQVAGCHSVSDR
jgi:hypothetical protein